MIEIIVAIVIASLVTSFIVYAMAKRKYQAKLKADLEERERQAKLEVARMYSERKRLRQEFMNSRMGGTSTPTPAPKQVVTTVTPAQPTYVRDDSPDILTAMILQQAMNSPTGTVAGTVDWDNGVPTVTPVEPEKYRAPEPEPVRETYTSSYSSSSSSDDSSSSRSSYSSSYSSSSSDSSYSSSSSDSSYSSSSDSSSSFSSD